MRIRRTSVLDWVAHGVMFVALQLVQTERHQSDHKFQNGPVDVPRSNDGEEVVSSFAALSNRPSMGQ